MTASPTIETPVSVPRKEELDEDLFVVAVAKIIDETSFNAAEAIDGIEFIREMTRLARIGFRCGTPGTHHLHSGQMETIGYRVMDAIMSHGKTAELGSAHAAVEDVVLDRTRGECALMHDNPSGKAEDCVVCLHVRAVVV